MPPLGFGIIGCGVIGPFHARAIQAAEGAELVACCDIIPERAEQLAAEFDVPHTYTDHRDMLARDDVNIVCICTPSGMHAEQGIACAEAGKHILVEKPIDVRLDRIDALVQAAETHGVKLGCIFQMRTYDASRRTREAVQRGRLGRMVMGDTYLKYYRSPEYYLSGDWRGTWELDGGGALMNQGVHGIDLLLWVMGPVRRVTAHADHLVRDIPVEDTAVAILEYESGAFGVIEGATSVHPGMPTKHEFHGDRGTIVLREQTIETWEIEGEAKPEQAPPGDTKTAAHGDPTAISSVGHEFQVQDMVHAVQQDREPYVPGRDARRAVECILAIYESARTGQTVELPLQVPTARF
jgi:predicted dehydrogenase